ncbi:hypothetical protein LINPERHAP2_LOCUS15271 [Linum perenne]
MNNTKLHIWDEMCKIFEVIRVDGTESMTVDDAVSRLEGQLRASSTTFDTYAAETNPMMEDFINQGYDMNVEGLKDVKEDTATKDATYKGKFLRHQTFAPADDGKLLGYHPRADGDLPGKY